MVINSVLLVKRTEVDYSTAKEAQLTTMGGTVIYSMGNIPDYVSEEYVADKVRNFGSATYILGLHDDTFEEYATLESGIVNTDIITGLTPTKNAIVTINNNTITTVMTTGLVTTSNIVATVKSNSITPKYEESNAN